MAGDASVIPRRAAGLAIVALLATLLLGSVAPFINGARFSNPIKRALEDSLGRPVEFDQVHFTLFTGPGFSLENVTIGEDPRYGLEPFAYVATLNAHVRLDRLLFGEVRFSSLRLVDPSLNLVKKNDGTWNVLELVRRLGAPRRAPLNLFPAFEVSNARVDFKFETRKTTLYLLNTDLAIYPQRGGKLYVQFSGSPARTDRAGNGFGHMRGTVNWYVGRSGSAANQLEANLTLDPSNLSEMATLLQGHDIGVHGTVSSDLQISGPLDALRVKGDLRVEDVHRWDLLPSSGENWRIRYGGNLDLVSHSLNLQTLPAHPAEATPVALELQMRSFITNPEWSLGLRIQEAPAQDLLPLARRMGLGVPVNVAIEGTAQGSIGVSSNSGLSGAISILNATATLPDKASLRSNRLNVRFSGGTVHLDPANIEEAEGTLLVGGNYSFDTRQLDTSFYAQELSVDDLKRTVSAWFGTSEVVNMLKGGLISGQVLYRRDAAEIEQWSGRYQFTNATLTPPGLSAPLTQADGRAAFDDKTFELSRLTAKAGGLVVRATYHYSSDLERPERVRVDIPEADVNDIESLLRPTLEPQTLLARLPFVRRVSPGWLANRNLEGDLSVANLYAKGSKLGPFAAHFVWEGTGLDFTSVQLKASGALMRAQGRVDLSSYQPRYAFTLHLSDLQWGGGSLSAEGRAQSFGTGADVLAHLQITGNFTGEDLRLTADDTFSKVSGDFDLSSPEGWPKLRLSNIEAADDEDAWTGAGSSQSDGHLVLDLQNADRQRHIISSLTLQRPSAVSLLVPDRTNVR